MFPTAPALSVNDAAKTQLESLVRSGATPQRVARKCRVILLAQQGMSNHSIAKQLGLSRPTVIAARATFSAGGVEALTAKPTRNRPRWALTAELEKKIVDTTLQTRPPDATQWTVRTLAKHLRVSRMMVQRVWQRFDLQPPRVEKFKLSNDP
jgi:transposase